MKQLIIVTVSVFLVCIAICTVSTVALNAILNEAHELSTNAFVSMEEGDITRTREGLVALATLWDKHAQLMSLLCAHEDLHEVKQRIIEAQICIEYTDMEDFYSNISLIGEGIEHIRDQEALSLANLY
jgi:hypothetical protein